MISLSIQKGNSCQYILNENCKLNKNPTQSFWFIYSLLACSWSTRVVKNQVANNRSSLGFVFEWCSRSIWQSCQQTREGVWIVHCSHICIHLSLIFSGWYGIISIQITSRLLPITRTQVRTFPSYAHLPDMRECVGFHLNINLVSIHATQSSLVCLFIFSLVVLASDTLIFSLNLCSRMMPTLLYKFFSLLTYIEVYANFFQ